MIPLEVALAGLRPDGIDMVGVGDSVVPTKAKKRKAKSALSRSMEHLRSDGYIVAKTERWNPWCGRQVNGKAVGILQDLFGFIDALALPMPDVRVVVDGKGVPPELVPIVAVQCVNTHLHDHIIKIKENEAAQRWLALGHTIVIHHWKKRSKNKVKFMELEVIEVVA